LTCVISSRPDTSTLLAGPVSGHTVTHSVTQSHRWQSICAPVLRSNTDVMLFRSDTNQKEPKSALNDLRKAQRSIRLCSWLVRVHPGMQCYTLGHHRSVSTPRSPGSEGPSGLRASKKWQSAMFTLVVSLRVWIVIPCSSLCKTRIDRHSESQSESGAEHEADDVWQ
jgi:hypothetical protein